MGALPQPADWAKDLWTKYGDRFNRIEARLDALDTARSVVATSVQADINASNSFSPTAFVEAQVKYVDVPKGYSQCYVLLFASAGQTVSSGTGTVGIWPVVDNVYTGPPISNGTPGVGAVSVSTFYAVLRTGLTDGSQIKLAAWCYNANSVGGALSPLSCNVHLSASLLFLR